MLVESRSVLHVSTTADVIAVIQTVYVSLTRCQHAQMFLSLFHSTGRRRAYLQCITDMPCKALGESLRAFRCCNDPYHRGCYRAGVRESDEDKERMPLSLSV